MKTSDSLPQTHLIFVFRPLSIRGTPLSLLFSYSKISYQIISVSDYVSATWPLTGDVIQDNVLGPLVFYMIANDIFAFVCTSLYYSSPVMSYWSTNFVPQVYPYAMFIWGMTKQILIVLVNPRLVILTEIKNKLIANTADVRRPGICQLNQLHYAQLGFSSHRRYAAFFYPKISKCIFSLPLSRTLWFICTFLTAAKPTLQNSRLLSSRPHDGFQWNLFSSLRHEAFSVCSS